MIAPLYMASTLLYIALFLIVAIPIAETDKATPFQIKWMLSMAIGLTVNLLICCCQRWLPAWFACDGMGWHRAPGAIGFDGCSNNGTCPRCNKEVMQDGQGNWF